MVFGNLFKVIAIAAILLSSSSTILDFSVGADLMQKERVSMNLQFDAQNLTNELFLYNFESVFSGTHVGYPRLFSGRLALRFK